MWGKMKPEVKKLGVLGHFEPSSPPPCDIFGLWSIRKFSAKKIRQEKFSKFTKSSCITLCIKIS